MRRRKWGMEEYRRSNSLYSIFIRRPKSLSKESEFNQFTWLTHSYSFLVFTLWISIGEGTSQRQARA